MDKDEAVKALKAISDADYYDTESAHDGADGILLKFLTDSGFKDIADAWEAVDEKVGGFWYA